MTRRQKTAFGLSATLVFAAIAVIAVFGPWLTMPDESPASIDRRWRDLTRWAGEPRAGDATELAAALATVHSNRRSLRQLAGDGDMQLATSDLTEPAREALTHLRSWHERSEGLGLAPCAHVDVLDVTTLLRLAIAASGADADDENLSAALHLGAALRGANLVDGTAGMLAATWAFARIQRGASVTAAMPLIERYRPRREEVFAMLARDAMCTDAVAADSLPNGASRAAFMRWARPDEARSDISWPPLGIVRPDRERSMLRKFLSDILHRAYPDRANLFRLADDVELPATGALPRSALVRLAAVPYAPGVRTCARAIDACDTVAARSLPGP